MLRLREIDLSNIPDYAFIYLGSSNVEELAYSPFPTADGKKKVKLNPVKAFYDYLGDPRLQVASLRYMAEKEKDFDVILIGHDGELGSYEYFEKDPNLPDSESKLVFYYAAKK